jgi:hypothetical protein
LMLSNEIGCCFPGKIRRFFFPKALLLSHITWPWCFSAEGFGLGEDSQASTSAESAGKWVGFGGTPSCVSLMSARQSCFIWDIWVIYLQELWVSHKKIVDRIFVEGPTFQKMNKNKNLILKFACVDLNHNIQKC